MSGPLYFMVDFVFFLSFFFFSVETSSWQLLPMPVVVVVVHDGDVDDNDDDDEDGWLPLVLNVEW